MTASAHSLATFDGRPRERVNIRVAAVCPVQLVMTTGRSPVLPARSADVGIRGICVRTPSMLDSTQIRRVRLEIGGRTLDLRVRVRWCSASLSDFGPLMGLEFEDVDSDSDKALWSFIQERAHALASFLTTCAGLSNLTFQEALELAFTTRCREVALGEVLYGGLGQRPSASIFALLEGEVLLERAGERRLQQIGVVRPRELFGGVPMITGCEPYERAVATMSSSVLEFEEYNTNYLLRNKPLLGSALVRGAAFHLIQRVTPLLDRLFELERRT